MRKTTVAVCLALFLGAGAVYAADMTDLLKSLPAIPAGGAAQDSGTVAGFIICALGAAMCHPVKDFKSSCDYTVGLPSPDIRNKSYAAGIMFVYRIIHPGLFRPGVIH